MEGSVIIKMNKVQMSEVPHYVNRAFYGDEDLLSLYHTSPGTLDHCVSHTVGLINENAPFYKDDIEYYSVNFNGNPIGYTVLIRNNKAPHELYSFGINKNYRKGPILKAWLAEIKKMLGPRYFIVLWSKNNRAISFFEKNKFVVDRQSSYLNDETKTLILCPQEE